MTDSAHGGLASAPAARKQAVASNPTSALDTNDVAIPDNPASYRDLVRSTQIPPPPPRPASEDELDTLVTAYSAQRQQRKADESAKADAPDPIATLRELTLKELVPSFVELVEKYADAGISMQMDASNFLQGGREMRFEFGLGEHRTQLLGTVTNEAIAFHETRFSPNVHGELASGPMLRLRTLTARTFREFICERLTLLLRNAMRRR